MQRSPISPSEGRTFSMDKLKALGRNGDGSGGSLGQQMAHGAFWMGLGQAAIQAGGLLRTAVLARFLSPAQFGIMGIVLVVVKALESLTNTGFSQALIQRPGDIDRFLPSVFFWNIGRGILLSTLLIIGGPFVADFFHEPGATLVIQSAAAITMIRALQNPKLAAVHRQMRYQHHFYWDASITFSGLIAAGLLLLVTQDVWVLMLSMIVEELVRTVGSYILAPWKPSRTFHLADIRELRAFGRWVGASSLVIFLSQQLDTITVGRLLSASSLGLYDLSWRISQIPATQVSSVVSTVSLPTLSKAHHNPARFRDLYLKIATSVWSISILVGIIMVVFAEQIVRIFLGEQWLSAVPSLRILAVAGLIRSIVTIGGRVFQAAGQPRYDFAMNLVRLIVLAVTIYPFVSRWGIGGAAFSVLLSISAVLPMYFFYIFRITGVTPIDHITYGVSRVGHVLRRKD
jgi:O-antigen/teichoic acid export membrane protein